MALPDTVRPDDVQQLCALIGEAAAGSQRLALQGGGSHAGFGAPVDGCTRVDLRSFSGIVDYDGPELVLTAGAGTALSEVQALLEEHQQMLAFDPFDVADLYGGSSGHATLGGVVASGLAGSRRLTRGSVRDHLLGFEAVSGRGEHFVAGGRVVKNVTGYDLPKLMCGSWGRLAALTQVTLKVLPAPRSVQTLQVDDLTPAQAQALFRDLLGQDSALAAAAYLPAGLVGGGSQALLRMEGFPPSVEASVQQVQRWVSNHPEADCLLPEQPAAVWERVRAAKCLSGDQPLWKLCVPGAAAVQVSQAFHSHEVEWFWDWAGGLIWVQGDVPARTVRALALAAGGHATLFRAGPACRAVTAALPPPTPQLQALEEKVRRAFDPAGVFETGRFRVADHED